MLKARYCRYVDTKQWDELGRLLASDPLITFENAEGAIIYQFSTAKDFVESCLILEKAVSIHHLHNAEIEILSESTAKAIWAMEDRIYFSPAIESPFKTLHGYGHYHETYLMEMGEWKIKSLLLKRSVLDIR
ncbi:nuclear transport factor 2 family protein [Dyadobacter sp. CY261]|uniref:nuclear transport factor 2 family protein n=1 Tax=Dyadobacter sp. CY261 TaxID=2907203 RepID=UPI001F29E98F|nr:nuclear transport factor 2 family protein [Dyadobacter sp. CY261]